MRGACGAPAAECDSYGHLLKRVSQRLRTSLGMLFGITLLAGSFSNVLADLPRGGLRLVGDTVSAGTNPYGSATVMYAWRRRRTKERT
jgi:hypothetical protein